MKTFLGFTTGLFVGLIGGVILTSVVLLLSPSTREALNKEAEELEELNRA